MTSSSEPAFTPEFLQETAHRPFPLPEGPWVLLWECVNTLFINWPVPAEEIRPLIPDSLTLDTRDGQAWISIVPFVSRMKPRGLHRLPVALQSAELNIRTYVTYRGGMPGLYFLRLNYSLPLPFMPARLLFDLKVRGSRIGLEREGTSILLQAHDRHSGDIAATVEPVGETFQAAPGTLMHWLAERYCLYTCDHRKNLYVGHAHHAPWPLQQAQGQTAWRRKGEFDALHLTDSPIVFFAPRQKMVLWPFYSVHSHKNPRLRE